MYWFVIFRTKFKYSKSIKLNQNRTNAHENQNDLDNSNDWYSKDNYFYGTCCFILKKIGMQ